MNETVNKFLLTGDRFIPEMHLREPGFTYSGFTNSRLFTKNKERIKKFKKTGDSRHIYQNKLNRVCSQHDMTDGDFKNLTRRIASDKILRDTAFNMAKNSKYDGYQHGLASEVYNLGKKTSGRSIKN